MAIGNYAAILTTFDEPLMMKFKEFLETIEFKGVCHFDIKYDCRDNTYKVFEINIRQGRGHYHVTGSGYNLARYFVEDYIEQKPPQTLTLCKSQHFWHMVPLGMIRLVVKNKALLRQAMQVRRKFGSSNSLRCKGDLKLRRRFYLFLAAINQYKKYWKYYR
jgi:D-aspartate ligase